MLNGVIHRNKGPGHDPSAVTVSSPLFSAFTVVYLIIFQGIQVRVNWSKSELKQVFSLRLLKWISCNKWKVALSPTGFQDLLRVVTMSQPLQKVSKYIIFEVLGNLIQQVVNSSHNNIPVIISSYGAERGSSHLSKDLHFSSFVCLK